jgi:hypothetical protein
MKIVARTWPLVILFVCCCLAIAVMQVAPFAGFPGGFQVPGIGRFYGPGGYMPPGGGPCSNIGIAYPSNPFYGWPVDFWAGDWNTVTSWFCDPRYFAGFTHYGIDLGRLSWSADPTHNIDGAPILCTTEKARVLQAAYCAPNAPCWNHGMGNFVQIEALLAVEVCETSLDENGLPVEVCEIIWEPSGWRATFMHLKTVDVAAGDECDYGQVIGTVDNSGNSTGPHLHYQINDPTGLAIDPAPSMANTYANILRDIYKGQR